MASRSYLNNKTIVILNEIPESAKLDVVKSRFLDSAVRGIHKTENLVRIARFQADSSTCQKRKSQNDNKKCIFEMASNIFDHSLNRTLCLRSTAVTKEITMFHLFRIH